MKFERVWSFKSIHDICMKCCWYTEGTGEDYKKMLDFVDSHKPTNKNITKVAENIYKYSEKEDRTLSLVADVLAREAVKLVLVEED